jgi:hypothetical protein
MKNLIKGILLLVLFAVPLGAQTPAPPLAEGSGMSVDKPNCGMHYGKSHFFMFCAPVGWTLDNSVGEKIGLFAMLYPDGSSLDSAHESGTFMYINTFDKPDDKYTVAKSIAFDADDTKQKSQAAVVKVGVPIKLDDLALPVQLFAPGLHNRFEAVAYIDSSKVIITFVMSSINEDTFKRDYPAFVQFVQSYKFMSSNVTIQHK